ncbi:hypothetical protein PHK61_31565 [Actinomycetospora lutea]|uniref:hypothetical protein n=1 Tax=Actinomycetospora lutea TaxID=663604 RepID=UPI0023671A23|nr:hypothetical protein [Actinomycetospora lutea]MDD7942954.1 hypothetical protein [Actinomycetospora lutea]
MIASDGGGALDDVFQANYDFVAGRWSGWGDLEARLFPTPHHEEAGQFDKIAIAFTTEGAHVLGVTIKSELLHQLLRVDSQFADVEKIGVGQDVGLFSAVDCA